MLQSYYEGEFPSLDEGDGAKEIHRVQSEVRNITELL